MLRWCVCLALCLPLGGCVQNEYDVELTPKGDGLERRFHVRRVANDSQEKLEADVARLAKEYGRKPPVANNEQRFLGHFTGRMPNDVGGHGTFARYDSPLGSVAIYVERFRGDDDLVGLIERRKAAVDQAVDLLIGWLEMELKDDARWPAYQTFLTETFRRDMYNITLLLFLTPVASDIEDTAARETPTEMEHSDVEFLMTVLHYFVEHGYLKPEEIPEWMRGFQASSEQDVDRILKLCRKLILARFDDGTQPPPQLKFLETWEDFNASLERYLKTTEDYRVAREAWLEEHQDDPDAEEPDIFEILMEIMASKNFEGFIQIGGDRLILKLNLDRPPMYTNGTKVMVDDVVKQLKWEEKPLPNAEAISSRAYAVWDEPNKVAQQSIFGRTVLTGKALLEYCLWYRGLTDEERSAWDDFLASLQPGPELPDTLKAFRFPGEPASDSPIAAPAAEAIIGGLKTSPDEDRSSR